MRLRFDTCTLLTTRLIRRRFLIGQLLIGRLQEGRQVQAVQGVLRCGSKAKDQVGGISFPAIFHTVDAVSSSLVMCSVCVVARHTVEGKSLYRADSYTGSMRRFANGAVRELKEETSIALSQTELDNYIKGAHNFDHPDRSERGRTITNAYLFDLGAGPLPKVKGQTMQTRRGGCHSREFYNREEEFFEDHFHIISFFVNKSF